MPKRLALTTKDFVDIAHLLQIAQSFCIFEADSHEVDNPKSAYVVLLRQWASRAADLREKIEGHEEPAPIPVRTGIVNHVIAVDTLVGKSRVGLL